ncbi:MAG: hypothetical protein R3C12_21015 [Planctomycetaceae bacterium]
MRDRYNEARRLAGKGVDPRILSGTGVRSAHHAGRGSPCVQEVIRDAWQADPQGRDPLYAACWFRAIADLVSDAGRGVYLARAAGTPIAACWGNSMLSA